MEQIFIRVKIVKNGVVNIFDKNIMESTDYERVNWYTSISKGQIVYILEKFIENKMMTNCNNKLNQFVFILKSLKLLMLHKLCLIVLRIDLRGFCIGVYV